jgi:hypothetical protein
VFFLEGARPAALYRFLLTASVEVLELSLHLRHCIYDNGPISQLWAYLGQLTPFHVISDIKADKVYNSFWACHRGILVILLCTPLRFFCLTTLTYFLPVERYTVFRVT